MEFLGVGPTEFLFIVIIALIVLGPKDLAKTGRTIGKWLNSMIQSDTWKIVRKVSEELTHLPTKLMRDYNGEKFLNEENESSTATQEVDSWSRLPKKNRSSLREPHAAKSGNSIQPPNSKAYIEGPPPSTLKAPKKKPSTLAPKKPTTTKKTGKKPATKPSTRTARKKKNA